MPEPAPRFAVVRIQPKQLVHVVPLLLWGRLNPPLDLFPHFVCPRNVDRRQSGAIIKRSRTKSRTIGCR